MRIVLSCKDRKQKVVSRRITVKKKKKKHNLKIDTFLAGLGIFKNHPFRVITFFGLNVNNTWKLTFKYGIKLMVRNGTRTL